MEEHRSASVQLAAEWAIEWRGTTWSSTDLTGHHAAAVAELLGIAPSWEWFDLNDVNPALGPLQTMALVAAFRCVDEGVRGTAAMRAILDEVKDATVDELLDAIRLP